MDVIRRYCLRCRKDIEIKEAGSKYEVCSICGKKLKESPWNCCFCYLFWCVFLMVLVFAAVTLLA